MDQPDTTTTAGPGPGAGTPSNAELAVTVDRIADQMAAIPLPPAPITPPPPSVFGHQGLGDAMASFYTAYGESAASLAADHQAMIGHLRATAAAYRAGDAEAAEQIMLAGLAAAAETPEPPTPPQ